MGYAAEYGTSMAKVVADVEKRMNDGEWSVLEEEIGILEVRFEVTIVPGGTSVTGVTFVVTIGGPHCEIRFLGNGNAVVHTLFGGDHDMQIVENVPNLESYAFQIAEESYTYGAHCSN